MDQHFLNGMHEGPQQFQPQPWYNADGDCIIYQISDEAFVAHRIDDMLTIYTSAETARIIGFQIKGVHAILRKSGWEGLTVSSKSGAGGVKSVSVAAMLLAAYEEKPFTMGRRRGYASAMQSPDYYCDIPLTEFQPA